MATSDRDDKSEKTKAGQAAQPKKGFSLRPRRYSLGQIRSLEEISKELGEQHLRVESYETAHHVIVSGTADTLERSGFVDYLLDRIGERQVALNKNYSDIGLTFEKSVESRPRKSVD